MLVEEGGGQFGVEGEGKVIFFLRLLLAGDCLAVIFRKYLYTFSNFCYPRRADENRVQGAEHRLDVRFERLALPAVCIPLHRDIHESECLLARHFVADLFCEQYRSGTGPEDIRYSFHVLEYSFSPAEFVERRALTAGDYQAAQSRDILFCPDRNDLNISFNFFGGGTGSFEMFLHIALVGEHSYGDAFTHIMYRARRGGSPISRSLVPPLLRPNLRSRRRPSLRH